MTTVQIQLRLFGAFRRFGDGSVLSVPLRAGSGISDLRGALAELLGGQHSGLIADSSFADESAILSDDSVFDRDCTVAVLPPVCGG
jgi:molybdopterin converting factor small subunit